MLRSFEFDRAEFGTIDSVLAPCDFHHEFVSLEGGHEVIDVVLGFVVGGVCVEVFVEVRDLEDTVGACGH